MLIATAGHIDHGKTSLIRALTGVDTDRLPEEKARGISIDLGFAYWRPDESQTISFIDVPGHERFVRNMLAGVGGIDFALLVIAADDGVMPQTLEHLEILDLLGIDRGAVVITKCDRSSVDRIAQVKAEIQILLAGRGLERARLFEVSAATGAGIEALAQAIRDAALSQCGRSVEGRHFRLSVDRAFTVAGAGTVVSGTVLQGAVEVGARLVLSPAGLEVRVRGLHTGGRPVARVGAGRRCALNLAGVDVGQIRRGEWLAPPAMHAPTSRLEVRLKLLPGRSAPLKHNTPVHLHLGAADLMGRVLLPRGRSVVAGEEVVAHIVLDHPTLALSGDRFVLRDASGRQTIGGGRVVDPFPPERRWSHADRAPVTIAMQAPFPLEALAALLAIPGHEVDAELFERAFNLEPAAASSLYSAADAAVLPCARRLALSRMGAEAVQSEIRAVLADFHRTQPDEGGLTQRALKARLTAPVSGDAFLALLKAMADEGTTRSVGALVRLSTHSTGLTPADEQLWRRVELWLETRGPTPFIASELIRELGVSELMVKAMLNRRRRNGDLFRIDEERYLPRQQVAALAARAATLANANPKGFTVAEYRDATGIGRNTVIRLLEFFDAAGVTDRVEEARKVRKDYQRIVGDAAPYSPMESR
jgi:selenocysteine-specific elongation factor